MLNFYYKYYKLKRHDNDTETLCDSSHHIICAQEVENIDIPITWDNVNEIYEKYRKYVAFEIINRKKGKIISFPYRQDYMFLVPKYFKPIKEWEKQELQLTLSITYEQFEPSIREISQYCDGGKAIQYLVERGLSIVTK